MSKPIEHSPAPWREDQYNYDLDHWQKGVAWCIRDAQGRTVVEGNPHNGEPLDANGKLIAAAPTMYHILRAIVDANEAITAVGVMDAAILLGELEGEANVEA